MGHSCLSQTSSMLNVLTTHNLFFLLLYDPSRLLPTFSLTLSSKPLRLLVFARPCLRICKAPFHTNFWVHIPSTGQCGSLCSLSLREKVRSSPSLCLSYSFSNDHSHLYAQAFFFATTVDPPLRDTPRQALPLSDTPRRAPSLRDTS